MTWEWTTVIVAILAFVFGLCWLSVWAAKRSTRL